MRIAYEAPLENTDLAIESSDFIFAIAPHILSSSIYKEAIKRANVELWIDNGVHEKARVSADELAAFVEDMRPQLIVAPDVVGDMAATLRLSLEFIERHGAMLAENDVKIMGVPQGTDDEQREHCMLQLLDAGVTVVGLGYRAFGRDDGVRWNFFENNWLPRSIEDIPIHILATASVNDIQRYSAFEDVSLDTSLPFQLAQKGKGLRDPNPVGPIDWEKKLTDEEERISREYLQSIRDVMNEGLRR